MQGQCIDLPNVPPGSAYHGKICIKAYPTREFGDIVWAYLGPPERMPSGIPQLEFGLLPPAHRYHPGRRRSDLSRAPSAGNPPLLHWQRERRHRARRARAHERFDRARRGEDKRLSALPNVPTAAAVRGRFTDFGAEPLATTPEELGRFISVEVVRWRGIITKAGITLDP